jgi:hypothetical protein
MSHQLDSTGRAKVRAAWREIEAKDPAAATSILDELDQGDLDTAIEMISWLLNVARDARALRDLNAEAVAG